MTTQAFEGPVSLRQRLTQVALLIVAAFAVSARPVWNHLIDHAYSIIGLGCIATAAFIHSTFTGFIVLGVMFLVFEWKVSE
jgi:hypothetical protein